MLEFKHKALNITLTLMIILMALSFGYSIYRQHFMMSLSRGISMLPTMQETNILLMKSDAKSYERGDIITFLGEKEGREQSFCKRIVGIPSDTLEIRDGRLFINGIYERAYLDDTGVYYTGRTDGALRVTLGNSEYFVLGDNREHSIDSRVFGVIREEQIYGKVLLSIEAGLGARLTKY